MDGKPKTLAQTPLTPRSGANPAAFRYTILAMKTTRWVVVGIGDISTRRVIPAILAEPRSSLHGFVTRTPAKAQPWPNTKTWPTVEAALEDPAVDALYLATPVALHAPAAIAALRAGKHVLCEKPMAMNFAESQQIVAAASSSKGLFAVAYYRRLFPKLIRARQLVAAGAIGKPVLAEGNCHGWLESEERAWLRDPALAGGGPLYDIASHRIDAMNFLFGQPIAATGLLSNALHQLPVEDSATALIQYPNGIHGIVDVRWNSRIKRDQFRILGTEGEINLDPLSGPELRIANHTEFLPTHANIHYPLIENFADALQTGAPLACPAPQASWTDWVIQQIAQPIPPLTC